MMEAHHGVVTFEALALGREAVLLGKVRVGEIIPLDAGRYQACFRLTLPDASASIAWWPVADIADARRLAAIKISDWLNAAGLVPTGGVS
ncbi:cupredoxin domain-containing protein [Bradyrhizobium yuanmingense]|uniref:cupredoxin domain-containing protein n=1 Tax=Bradyrhizobium yuanmingense TaxID=108015 RepID=UPI001F0A8470|nr:cupredoxin domain-containing protein [Bradyrhizobium yuanmingense]